MKIAVLISGEARFCQEFDLLLSKLTGNLSVDWFFYLWKNENHIEDRPGWILVSSNWTKGDKQWAIDKIESCLPKNHSIKKFEFADKNLVPINNIQHKAWETNLIRMFGMYFSLFQVDQLRHQYQKESAIEYDLVIRARPDIGITGTIEFEKILNHTNENPNVIYIPENHIYGYEYLTNDMIAFGSSQSISIYCDLYNHILSYNQNGILCHPKTMLAYHLQKNNIETIRVKSLGQILLRNMGTNLNGAYQSNFGRWE